MGVSEAVKERVGEGVGSSEKEMDRDAEKERESDSVMGGDKERDRVALWEKDSVLPVMVSSWDSDSVIVLRDLVRLREKVSVLIDTVSSAVPVSDSLLRERERVLRETVRLSE